MNKIFLLIGLISFLSCESQAPNQPKPAEPVKQGPRNVILMIGDGMGLAQLQAAMTIRKGELNVKNMEHTAFVTTHSADDYVTDSGAAGTAIATGTKTNNGTISLSPQGDTLLTLAELAKYHSLGTGLVATCALTHATPAAFYAHELSRDDAEAIAEDFLANTIDVAIGGGRDHFEKRNDQQNLSDRLRAMNYQIAYDMEGLNAVNPGKVLGLLWEEHPPKLIEGRGDYFVAASMKAIELLSQHEKGFFLMIEASQIDWAGHANDLEYNTTETLEFDSLIGRVLDFAAADGNTLVIVTADHETGGLSLEQGDYEKGEIDADFSTKRHTGIMVPLFAHGPGADQFSGIIDNTELFPTIADLLELSMPEPVVLDSLEQTNP